MAGITVGAKIVALDALGALIKYMSLHSADPGTTGASELSGGSYARQAVTFGAAAADGTTPTQADKALTNQPAWPVPAGGQVAYIGWWSAATGGTFYGSEQVPAETYNQAGTYTNTANQIMMN